MVLELIQRSTVLLSLYKCVVKSLHHFSGILLDLLKFISFFLGLKGPKLDTVLL